MTPLLGGGGSRIWPFSNFEAILAVFASLQRQIKVPIGFSIQKILNGQKLQFNKNFGVWGPNLLKT